MALDKAGLKNNIKGILNSLKNYDGSNGKTQDDAIEKFSTDLSNAIDTFVKTGTVTTNVNVTGVTTGTGTTSGVGSGGIS